MNAYTLAETIAEITKAQALGDTVCGQIGDMRYNSSDALAALDINRMAQKLMDQSETPEERERALPKWLQFCRDWQKIQCFRSISLHIPS